MKYKTLGDTGLLVSTLCFGTMTFHGGAGRFRAVGQVDQSGADGLVKKSLEAGIKLAPQEIAVLDEVSALPPEYPGWMLKLQGTGRLGQ